MMLRTTIPSVLLVLTVIACKKPHGNGDDEVGTSESGASETETGTIPDMGGDEGPDGPFDELGNTHMLVVPDGLSPADCRAPTQWDTSLSGEERVVRANLMRPCRQIKQVQAYLDLMMDPRQWLDSGAQDADENTRRRWRFFGEWYHRDTKLDCEGGDPPSGSRPANAFPRLTAILLASDNPIDRRDMEVFAEVDDDDWWWELPEPYASMRDPASFAETLAMRRSAMREDVAAWLATTDISLYDRPGAVGDYDFEAMLLLAFLYNFRDRPELLGEYQGINLVERILTHGGAPFPFPWDQHFTVPCPANPAQPHPWQAGPWEHSGVPMSGPYTDELYDSEDTVIGCSLGSKSYDSENHVLMQLTYQYLVNQWVSEDYHDNLDPVALLGDIIPANDPAITGPEDWFVTEGQIADDLLAALARVVHNGSFETNARAYEGVSTQAILLLASHAEREDVRVAAEAALDAIFTKFAFQALDGRRWAPMRRSCKNAWDQGMYLNDGVAQIAGVLSGAFKWNDSPYGLRGVLEGGGQTCVDDPACHFRDYSFKILADPTDAERYAEDAGIATTANIDRWVVIESISKRHEFTAAFSRYRIPPPVHEFMFDKHAGYWARLSARYQRDHYDPPLWATSDDRRPGYFTDELEPFDAGTNYERTPELYFAGRGFINAAGGLFNPYYDGPEDEGYVYPDRSLASSLFCASEGLYVRFLDANWLIYLDDFGRSDDFDDVGVTEIQCESFASRDPEVSLYDMLSRPHAVLLEVPKHGLGGFEVYEPIGLRYFPTEVAAEHMPLMLGHERTPWKSVNTGTFKNVSYGYAAACSAGGTCADNHAGSAVHLPPSWTDATDADGDGVIVDSETVVVGDGNAIFTIYDLREWSDLRGMTPLFFLVADVWKNSADPSIVMASRSFWEVIPESARFQSLADVVAHVESLGAAEFPADVIESPYRYPAAMSGEELVLGARHGAVVPDDDVPGFADVVQGIVDVFEEPGGAAIDPTLRLELDDLARVNDIPLVDVRAVDEDYEFISDAQGRADAYACGRDGWLCVDNHNKWSSEGPDAGAMPSYLWVDMRPQAGSWVPRWEWGVYESSEDWGCSCEPEFVDNPGPPSTAVVQGCSDPDLCPINSWE